MNYTLDQLKIILENHTKWLKCEEGGYGADLSGANLSRANLYRADLSRANLYGADLSGADLSRANLYGADLSGADLSRANLSRANLYRADLSGANLYGADSDYAILLSICGMSWSILIKDDLIKVGCQEHTYIKWKSFTDAEVSQMSTDALNFYHGILIPLLDFQYKNSKFEIK
jgi:uncharacterized protein YjbI with pentapeptide repeats